MHSGKGGGADQKKKIKPQCTAGGRKAQSEQAAGGRVGANGAEEGPPVAREKKTQVTRWGIGTGTGGRGGGARKKGPQQDQKETNHPNKRGKGATRARRTKRSPDG